jgi:tripartite-type tricarboxylate transporter receptor subunit TctC
MRTFMKYLVALGVLGSSAAFVPAMAQTPSDGSVTIVVPYGPGGNGDLAARAMTASLQQHKDVPTLVVLNRAGAGGVTGSQSVIKAPRDGKTLLLARVGSQVVAPALDPTVTYSWDSFTPLGLLEIDPYVCVVAKDAPYKTLQDLVSAIKARPGKLSYASSGTMDASVVFPTKILLNAGLKPDAALMVPYKSGTETLTAVLGGQVDFACNGLSPYVGNLLGGQTRALVVSTSKRVAQLPDVPTAEEVGMPNLELVSGWSALYGPPGLPKEVVSRWSELLSRLSNDAKWVEGVKARGALPQVMSPQDTQRFVEKQFNDYRSLRDQIKTPN